MELQPGLLVDVWPVVPSRGSSATLNCRWMSGMATAEAAHAEAEAAVDVAAVDEAAAAEAVGVDVTVTSFICLMIPLLRLLTIESPTLSNESSSSLPAAPALLIMPPRMCVLSSTNSPPVKPKPLNVRESARQWHSDVNHTRCSAMVVSGATRNAVHRCHART